MTHAAEELIFEDHALRAEVIFVGTRCARDNLLRDYRSGSMHFVRAGRAEVLLERGGSLLVDEPTLVFFPLGCPHWVRAVDDAGFDLVCAFTRHSNVFGSSATGALPEVLLVPIAQLQPIDALLHLFFSEAQSQAPGARQMADRLCTLVLGYVARHVLLSGSDVGGALAVAADPHIAAAVRAVHRDYANALNLEALAREASMSRSRFVERFCRVVGISPHRYLTNHRIAVAQELLTRHIPVKTVAGRVGYADASAFVRTFKGVMGVTPAAWAASMRTAA